jgi:ABC-type dipeptide/oligopeptide/nickel transport system ATPase component
MALLEVSDLHVGFRNDSGEVFKAVHGVSFSLEKGKTLALVGESGSGKSVTALSLTRLLPAPPAEITSGRILLDGADIVSMPERDLRKIRGYKIGYIFQEPGTALNPVFSVRNQLAEAIRLHRPDVKDVDDEIVRWLDRVGIVGARERMSAYPHELSGGMQQRVMIAMALACHPDILVADEPTTALDVTIQRAIMALLKELQDEIGMAVLLITHNFKIIRGVAHDVAVMFRGEIVEHGPVDVVMGRPQHPYTRALIECIPRLGHRVRRLHTIDYDGL